MLIFYNNFCKLNLKDIKELLYVTQLFKNYHILLYNIYY